MMQRKRTKLPIEDLSKWITQQALADEINKKFKLYIIGYKIKLTGRITGNKIKLK
jgi:hypothetical protein